MGWNTPLFQRFQHMSLQSAKLGGLAIYGGHPQVDKDLFVFEKTADDVVVFDAQDPEVTSLIIKAVARTGLPVVLRVQSIDLATRVEDLNRFLELGFIIVYEYIDEISPEITGAIPPFVEARHQWILEHPAIFVVATSDKLFAQVSRLRSHRCMLSTNGVDLKHWQKRPPAAPEDIKPIIDTGRIIIGYHGALARWIDYELLAKIATDGRYELVLIGYEHDSSLSESGLLSFPTVHFLGSKSYFSLNQYAAFYDIAILPFKRYELTDSVSPVKLFEYMAAHKPIVTTDLHECNKYSSCLVSKSTNEFMRNLEVATELIDDDQYKQQLSRDAKANSWEVKTRNVLSEVGIVIC